jgi:hypothetical protein
MRITEECIEDDQYRIMSDGARELGVSARETRHINVAEIFNTGFVTTYHTAGDAAAIFSASHIRLDGVAWSNVATASALGYSTLQNAILAFESQVDHRGKKIMQTPMTLLVPPALEYKALELLETVGNPENANNTINAVTRARPSIKLVVLPYLTSATAWFLIDAANKVHLLGVGVYPQKEGRGGKEYPCVSHLTIPVLAWEIEQFEYEVERIGEEIILDCQKNGLHIGEKFEENLEMVLEHKLHRAFPTSTSRCYFNINNPCQFLDLCTRDWPRGLVEGNYVVDPFLPWEEEAKEE